MGASKCGPLFFGSARYGVGLPGRFKPLKDIQKQAALVPESEDAALAEERYSGKVRA
jgi:hypothetical protein